MKTSLREFIFKVVKRIDCLEFMPGTNLSDYCNSPIHVHTRLVHNEMKIHIYLQSPTSLQLGDYKCTVLRMLFSPFLIILLCVWITFVTNSIDEDVDGLPIKYQVIGLNQ